MQENSEENPGEDFLEKKDEKHKELLRELNGYLDDPHHILGIHQNKIANFAQEHYKTFIAAMQNGLHVCILNQLNESNKKALLNIIKQADKKGMILAKYDDKVYLINTKDEHNKTLNLIYKRQINNPEGIAGIEVTAHPYMNYDDFSDACDKEYDYTLYLYPLNDKFLSFISSRQTEGVENTCKIINYFTEKSNNKQIDVTLDGASQGVDFITKMVGSTHGKTNRIKNANITLKIDSTHLFQDGKKIVNRLIKGIGNEENNNTIKNISIDNSMGEWKHPKCKTDNLKAWLNYYKQKGLLKVNEIVDLTDAGPNQQHALY